MTAATQPAAGATTATGYQGFVDCILSGRIPSRQEFILYLEGLDPLQAVVLLAVGLLYMLAGWKVFKVLVIINAALLGLAVGHVLGNMASPPGNLPTITAVAGALLLGVLAWPLMKYAVSVMGALIGAFLGFFLWRYLAEVLGQQPLGQYAWAGGLLGLITLGMLAFVILRLAVIVFTAFQGVLMSLSAVLALLLRYEPYRLDVENEIINNIHMMPFLLAVPTLIAVVIQYVTQSKKAKKKPSGGG